MQKLSLASNLLCLFWYFKDISLEHVVIAKSTANLAVWPGCALYAVPDAKMPGNNYTYRAFRNMWVGTPCYPPSIAVLANDMSTQTVFASWNGSTETVYWQVYAGNSPSNLRSQRSA